MKPQRKCYFHPCYPYLIKKDFQFFTHQERKKQLSLLYDFMRNWQATAKRARSQSPVHLQKAPIAML